MKSFNKMLIALCLIGNGLTIHAQNTITTTGSNATGSGGTVSYSIGQVTYHTSLGTSGTVVQGVQQPFEISIVTTIEKTEDINLECIVYPNPTEGILRLFIKSYEIDNMSFKLLSLNGVLVQEKIIEDRETEISLLNVPSAIYFLKVLKNTKEIKTFKIVKR